MEETASGDLLVVLLIPNSNSENHSSNVRILVCFIKEANAHQAQHAEIIMEILTYKNRININKKYVKTLNQEHAKKETFVYLFTKAHSNNSIFNQFKLKYKISKIDVNQQIKLINTLKMRKILNNCNNATNK